jgi:hypothetical protein
MTNEVVLKKTEGHVLDPRLTQNFLRGIQLSILDLNDSN